MNALIRFYNGPSVREYALDEQKSFVIGEGSGCDAGLERGALGGARAEFFAKSGAWRVKCKGKVVCGSEPIKQKELKNGDTIVLEPKKKIYATFLLSGDKSREVPLNFARELSIGRSESCELRFANPKVSGIHAKLYRTESGYRLCDMNSTNGTFLNGVRISDEALSDGDAIGISVYTLEFRGDSLTVRGAGDEFTSRVPAPESGRGTDYPYFKRSPRLRYDLPRDEIELEKAPEIGGKPEINWLGVLLPPIAMIAVMGVSAALLGGTSSLLVTGPMMLISVVVSITNYASQKKKYAALEEKRSKLYEDYVSDSSESIEKAVGAQRQAMCGTYPELKQCMRNAAELDRSLWDRSSGDDDFVSLRMGSGDVPFYGKIKAPRVGLVLEEDDYMRRPQQLADKYAVLHDMPIVCPLRQCGTLGVAGERARAVDLVKNLVADAAFHHSYDELKIIALFPEAERAQWEWIRWLPHCFDDARSERYVACTAAGAKEMLRGIADSVRQRSLEKSEDSLAKASGGRPYYLFVIADSSLVTDEALSKAILSGDPSLSVGAILLADSVAALPRGTNDIAQFDRKGWTFYARDNAGERKEFKPDEASNGELDAYARSLAPVRLPEIAEGRTLPDSVTFLEGYGVKDPEQLDIAALRAGARGYESLAVPIGVRGNGELFKFDIHEKKHGPHGLVAGMTGSGKSEMVQSWILSMALRFAPDECSFVLIDFKGTGLILPFLKLPHLAGTVSDLDVNISRNLLALESELFRRKELLDAAGVNNIIAYQKAYKLGKVAEPMPFLFVVIDEFAEFKVQFPDFMTAINSIFATGRTLGVFAVLMTQKPSGVVDDKMNANTRFRWCLKVASSADSREMLHHSDAARITRPGRAFVQVGEDEVYEEIQSLWSGATYSRGKREKAAAAPRAAAVELSGRKTYFSVADDRTTGTRSGVAEIDAVIRHICAYHEGNSIPAARKIWQQKLPANLPLPRLLERFGSGEAGRFEPLVGLVDDPRSQSQYPLRLPFGTDGHVIVYGAPGTGKTTFLQTLAASLCSSFGPDEVNIYMMDFGGWNLGIFRDFPQVGAVANDNDEESILGIAELLTKELGSRKRRFSQHGVGNIRAFREASGEKLPYIVLILDNFTPVSELFPQLDGFFVDITREGGNYGIYLAMTVTGTVGVNYRVVQNIKTALALQLTDKADYSTIVGKTQGLEPDGVPGRGLMRAATPLEFQTALPADGASEGERVAEIKKLGAQLAERFGASAAKGLIKPGETLPWTEIPDEGIVLGLSARDDGTVRASFGACHYLLVSDATRGSGEQFAGVVLEQAREKLGAKAEIFAPGDAARADACFEALAAELARRKEAKKNDPAAEFTNVFIGLAGWKALFAEIAQDTAKRIEAVMRLGKGLGVYIVIADACSELASLFYVSEPITSLASKGPAVMIGGAPRDHVFVEAKLDVSERAETAAEGAGWYNTDKGTEKIRLAGPRED